MPFAPTGAARTVAAGVAVRCYPSVTARRVWNSGAAVGYSRLTHPLCMNDPVRGIYTNRTLNLRSIKAVGYDMDYTLIHYHTRAWEERAYSYIKERLLARGWPVEDLQFDPDLVLRGLIIDKTLGNVVKANRFGYIKKAFHGTQPLEHPAMREVYTRTLVDLAEPRWQFMNTFFSLSEASMYMQLVDLLDADVIEAKLSYADLYALVRGALDEAHMEGRLKGEIIEEPEHFVALDPEVPLTLLDQKEAGKKILLITNSEWAFAAPMLTFAFDPFLPDNMTWRDLFDIAIGRLAGSPRSSRSGCLRSRS